MLLGFRCCGRSWRSHNCEHVSLLPEILRRYPLDLVCRLLVDFGFQFPIVIKAESIKLVECRHIGKYVVTLVLDLLLTDQFIIRPRQLACSQAVAREFLNLIPKCLLHWFYFLRISAEIKRELTWAQGMDLRC